MVTTGRLPDWSRSGKAKDERTDNTSPLFLPIAPEEELDDTEEDGELCV